MTEKEKQNIVAKIVERIKSKLKVKEIIVFGSYANDTVNQDSDLDLVVILDEKGSAVNYAEKFERRRKVTKLLEDYRRMIPLDVLVYSSEEWEKLKLINSSFIKEINIYGVRVS